MNILFIILLVFFTACLIAWLGLRVKAKPFSMPVLDNLDNKFVPFPGNLPEPVNRFFRTVYGDQIPVIETAVLNGRGKIRPFGIWLPARFVFVHNVGKDYRHYIEATFFGLPFLKVNEGYLDGESFFESPMGSYYNDANTNQGANLAVWAEAGWFPSIWAIDPRVQWTAVDDKTALLYVPFEDSIENFVVRFNPQTGLIDTMEAMRYREPGEGKSKILWITRNEPGDTISGMVLSATGSAIWLDQGKPWAFFTLEDLGFNLDVSKYIRMRGH